MENDLHGLFTVTKNNIARYIDLRLKLLKIETYEKAGKVSSVLLLILMILFVVFFAVLFLFLGLGFYLGQILDSLPLGMALTGVLYLILLAGVVLCRNKITNNLFKLFVSELMKDDDGEEQTKS